MVTLNHSVNKVGIYDEIKIHCDELKFKLIILVTCLL